MGIDKVLGKKTQEIMSYQKYKMVLTGVAHFFGHHPTKRKLPVQFLVRVHNWVTGSVPGRCVYKRQPVNISHSHQ